MLGTCLGPHPSRERSVMAKAVPGNSGSHQGSLPGGGDNILENRETVRRHFTILKSPFQKNIGNEKEKRITYASNARLSLYLALTRNCMMRTSISISINTGTSIGIVMANAPAKHGKG